MRADPRSPLMLFEVHRLFRSADPKVSKSGYGTRRRQKGEGGGAEPWSG